ncbi:MAG: helix-turn-helix domain-containing protein [Actinomycetota bacterium]|nr:helix-turn-helix domain-containing protein [Actinomycetota bacterium]
MRAQERSEHILRVAAEVFADKGYRNSAVSDIVDRAGIGRGTFYLYFSSKKEIFLELIEKYFQGFARLLERNHKQLEEAFRNHEKVLRTWHDNMYRVLEYHQDNPHLTNIIYREALGSDEDFSERVEELARLAREKLVEEFEMMYENGMMRECDIEVVSTIIIGTSINVVMQHLLREKGRDLDELVDIIVEYHIRALIPEEGDTARALRGALGKRVVQADIKKLV